MSKKTLQNSDRDDNDIDLELDHMHDLLNDVRRRLDALEGRGAPQPATGDRKRLNKLESQLGKLGDRLEALRDEFGEHIDTLRQTREVSARNASAEEDAALSTLAKAAGAFRRQSTPEGLIARASKAIKDPSLYGAVEAYASSGQLAKASNLVEAAERQAVEADEDEALAHVERQVDKGSQLAQLSELSGAVATLQRTLESVTKRLTQLERRPAPMQPTVAKASGGRQKGTTPYADTPAGLATRLENAFDDPAQVGTLSSMLQSRDPIEIEKVRRAVEAQELHHEGRARRGR